jgi:hypothetical protein
LVVSFGRWHGIGKLREIGVDPGVSRIKDLDGRLRGRRVVSGMRP